MKGESTSFSFILFLFLLFLRKVLEKADLMLYNKEK